MLKKALSNFAVFAVFIFGSTHDAISQSTSERQSIPLTNGALAGQQIKYSGSFTNTTFNKSGNITITMVLEPDDRISGYINFTNYPEVGTLCGAGNFTGFREGRSIQFSFVSNDPDPGCGFDRGWIFAVNATLSSDNTVLGDGIYQVDMRKSGGGGRGIFRVAAEK